jgi:hypothetical protein
MDDKPQPPEAYTLTLAESAEWYERDWLYRMRMPKMPKPPELESADAELAELYDRAAGYNMFATAAHQRSTKKVAVAALAKYQRKSAARESMHSEWLRITNTHANRHRLAVRSALGDGLPVPAEVLAEYPDLRPAEDRTDIPATWAHV